MLNRKGIHASGVRSQVPKTHLKTAVQAAAEAPRGNGC
jgi:hypothetical protein